MSLRGCDYKTRDSARGWSELLVSARALTEAEVRGVFGPRNGDVECRRIRDTMVAILVRRADRFFARHRKRFARRVSRLK